MSADRDTAAKTKNEKCSLDVPQDLAGALLSEGKDWPPGGARIWLFFPMKIYDQTSFKEKSTNISTNKMESMISLCDLWLPEAGRRTHLQFICNIFVEMFIIAW